MDLDVPTKNVHFKAVETKTSGNNTWTYSELEVHLATQHRREKIRETFSKNLSHVTPEPSIKLSQGASGTVVHVSYKGNATHRITIVPFVKEGPVFPSITKKKAKVAIIIDDMGYDYDMAKKLLQLDGNLSFSILPRSPFRRKIATSAHRKGRDVLLHLPMEPIEYPDVNPGKGALLESMSPDTLISQLEKNLDTVPFVVGVNNHMGSRLTQNAAKMRQIFTILKRRDLFFVDSVTTPRSRCSQAAKLLDLKFAKRQVFLDHDQEPNAIRFQIKRLLTIAKKHGHAIGIGHPYPTTVKVIEEELENIDKEVYIVPVSQLVS